MSKAGDQPKAVALAQEAIEDKLGRDIEIYDVRGRSSVTDYFMIASAASVPQLKAIGESIGASVKSAGSIPHSKSGEPESGFAQRSIAELEAELAAD